MTINIHEIIEACEVLASQDNLSVCVQQSLRGAAMAALGSFIGGVIFGSKGIAAGAAVGGVAGCATSEDFKPLIQIIQEMGEQEKNRMAKHMQEVLNSINVTDFAALMAIVQEPTSAHRTTIVKGLGNFFNETLVAH